MTRQGLGIALLAILVAGSPSAEAVVFTLEVDDVIHPVIAEYIDGGLRQAEEEGAAAVIIQMNTPGGFDSSMREIIEKILRSETPVLVFVGPSGARAASAGFFILLSGDLAVMAPGTNTGAAHPVPLGGGKLDEVMQKKVENDAAAYIRSFVAQRGRNVELAEKGVLESLSFTEEGSAGRESHRRHCPEPERDPHKIRREGDSALRWPKAGSETEERAAEGD